MDCPSEGNNNISPPSAQESIQSRAFLTTICISVDSAAETTFASIFPAAAAAAEEAAAAQEAEAVQEEALVPADAHTEGNCTKLHVEVHDSDSSEAFCDTDVESSTSGSPILADSTHGNKEIALVAPAGLSNSIGKGSSTEKLEAADPAAGVRRPPSKGASSSEDLESPEDPASTYRDVIDDELL